MILNQPSAPHTFSFGGSSARHYLKADDCDACPEGYPVDCECGDGYVHAQKSDTPGIDYLFTKCDECGESE